MKASAGNRSTLMLLGNNPFPQDQRVLREATALHRAGWKVTVICPTSPGQPGHDTVGGIEVRRYSDPFPNPQSPLGYVWEYAYGTAAALALSLGTREASVIHAHNPPDTFAVVGLVHKLLGRRFVFDHHDLAPEMYDARFGGRAKTVVRRGLLLFERLSFLLADRVITTNESYKRVAIERGKIPSDRIHVVRNGPDLERVHQVEPDPDLRARAGTIIGYVGTMGYQDGLEYLIRAMGHLVHDLGREDVLCVLIGAGDSLEDMRRLTAEHALEQHVHFTGRVSDQELRRVLSTADICADPDPSNPFNDRSTMTKMMEYMAFGKPIVAFDLPEHRVSAGPAALYVPTNDARAFAEALAKLADDPERREAMGKEGLSRVAEELAWDYSVPNLLQCYDALIAPATAGSARSARSTGHGSEGTSPTPLGPEETLLLACARVELSSDAEAQARSALGHRLDWDYVLQLAIRHAVAPLLSKSLDALAADPSEAAIPGDVRERLRDLRAGNERRELRLYAVVDELSEKFADAGVELLGLKEIQLARHVYPPGLRPFGDLDLLIRRDDYDVVADVLRSLRFETHPGDDLEYTLKYAWGHDFRRGEDDTWLDVQWNVLQREWDVYEEGNVPSEIDGFWRRSEPLQLERSTIRVPSPEDMLFHLCLHAEGHGFAELILLCDIAELVRTHAERLDWDAVTKAARTHRAQASLARALVLAVELLDAPVPRNVLDQLSSGYFPGGLVRALFSNLTTLHLSLDEIRTDAAAPAAAVAVWERVVRRQTRAAIELFRECDGLLDSLLAKGADAVAVTGSPSERLFPSEVLDPFAELQILLLDRDLDTLQESLRERGFAAVEAESTFSKQTSLASVDPALDGERATLALTLASSTDPSTFLAALRGESSRRGVAWRSAIARSDPQAAIGRTVAARVRLTLLPPEEMIVTIALALEKEERERLFHVCCYADLLRVAANGCDWDRVASLARESGVEEPVRQALLMATFVTGSAATFEAGLAKLPKGQPPKMFRLARYGDQDIHRYEAFKAAFFVVFTARSLRGLRKKTAYALEAVGQGRLRLRPAAGELPSLIRSRLSGSLNGDAADHAAENVYWVEAPAPKGVGQKS